MPQNLFSFLHSHLYFLLITNPNLRSRLTSRHVNFHNFFTQSSPRSSRQLAKLNLLRSATLLVSDEERLLKLTGFVKCSLRLGLAISYLYNLCFLRVFGQIFGQICEFDISPFIFPFCFPPLYFYIFFCDFCIAHSKKLEQKPNKNRV